MKLIKYLYKIIDSFKYFKIQILIATLVYSSELLSGMIFFRNNFYDINPQKLTFLKIFTTNFGVAMIIIIFGLLSCGIMSITILFANGLLLGDILIGVYNKYGTMPLITGILPHFFFEIIGLILATCISFETYKLLYNLKHENIKIIRFSHNLRMLILMIVLIFLAAIIESNLKIQY